MNQQSSNTSIRGAMNDSIHCIFVGLDANCGNSDGKKFNPSLIVSGNEISICQDKITTIVFSASYGNEKGRHLELGNGIQEDWIPVICPQNHQVNISASFISLRLLHKMQSIKSTTNGNYLNQYIIQSGVNQIVFCDLYPFKSELFNNMISEDWVRVLVSCTKSIAIIRGLHKYSESDISTEDDSVNDARQYYEDRGWKTIICNKKITIQNILEMLIVKNSVRAIRTWEVVKRISLLSNSINYDMLSLIANINDLEKRNYSNSQDFINNALEVLLKNCLFDDYPLFCAVCPDWKKWSTTEMSKVSFPINRASAAKELVDSFVKKIPDYYHCQLNKIQQK